MDLKLPQNNLKSIWLGTTPYDKALQIQSQNWRELATQESLIDRRCETTSGVTLGLEHPSVITLGKRGNARDDIAAEQELLQSLDIKILTLPRGGQATLHSPGQLVIYPIVRLADFQLGVRQFVHLLETVTIEVLAGYNICATQKGNEPGLYTNRGKIAFFGLQISQGVSTHGLAINVNNDLSLFQLIRSCGVANEKFDSVANYRIENPISTQSLFERWSAEFYSKLLE